MEASTIPCPPRVVGMSRDHSVFQRVEERLGMGKEPEGRSRAKGPGEQDV